MDQLTVGVVATSRKEHERRLPIHPRHVERIPEDLRDRVVLEEGYGASFGVPDSELAPHVRELLPRSQVLAGSDVVLLPKPQHEDVAAMRPGQVLWGWPHCVQDDELTQLAIDRRLTVLAWEAMNHWTSDGSFGVHVFHENNELAGYCSVLHAMTSRGQTGSYGRPLSAAVIGFGATGRGAVTALNALGVSDVTVLTHRDVGAVAAPIHSTRIVQIECDADDPSRSVALQEGERQPLARLLAGHDVVVNCVFQDTDAPLMFVTEDELSLFRRGTVLVDVSCDPGMGFSWARATTFDEPTLAVGDGVAYYAVDHSPSFLWDSATWEISTALLPYLPDVLAGSDGWDANETLQRAVEIRDGVVQNAKILRFQHRSPEYPHAVVAG